ncbi:hypothetical protein, conserved in T. vivax [Trypanosoma vivax Y486]|uniref:Uncharacterized protein n=1 Tax=Trypanosoma vivax (strain Y486) TaxID=1055687 RepID=F9WRK2_TRYVY|nr:hypothetical protein, conserved in T. vivax [Trypanosoma vivax Y486]|eukprot:CCD20186.1 hypothetical protein, conserved in T. vivax [Trypanosoma vivax Y486]
MASKCFWLLMFFLVAWCDATTKHVHYCWNKRITSREKKCATQDVVWGWLNVVNQPALRAEAVKKNVSEVMLRARDMRSRAENEAIKYKKLRASLVSSGTNAELAIISQSIAAVSEAIAQINQSEQKANEAMKKADESIISSTHCFNAIMRVACYLWAVDSDGTWNYASVKETFDVHDTDDCKKKYNVSKILNSSTENIDTVSLAEWKKKTLEVLNKTYDGIKLNTSRYHWSVTTSDDKINEVRKAVAEAVGHLEVAVQNFELYRTTVNDAVKKVSNASSVVEAANNSVLASANGKMLCEVVGRFSNGSERLRAAVKKLTGATQGAVNAVTYNERVQVEVGVADELVKEVGTWLEGNYLALVHKLSGTHDVTEANDALSTSVRTADEANSIIGEIARKMEAQSELLRSFQTQLANMSAAAGNKISNATFEACNDGVSEILKNKSPDVIRNIARFNTTLLTELNASLHKIGSTADVIERNLSGVNKQVQEAESSARDASMLAKQATENVKQTIVKVMSGVVAKLCATLSELRALLDKSEAFSAHAANASANVSEWLARIDTAAKESDALVDLPTSVEDAFATAEKRLEVLKRVLHRADEQRGKVAGELAASAVVAERSRNGAAQVNKTLRDVLANITSRVSATFSKDVCNASLMSESLKLLGNRTDHTAVMSSLKVVAQLNRLADSMEGQVLKGRRLMRVAGASSAQVDAALEEAIRMARERSGKPQCPALYRQLLGALGLHW